jgi:hypothetical protein
MEARPRSAAVNTAVDTWRNSHKVLRPVIALVSVDVMNHQARGNSSSHLLLHHPDVDIPLLPILIEEHLVPILLLEPHDEISFISATARL